MWGGYDGWGMGGGFGMGFGMIFTLLFWVLVILGIVVLVRWLGAGSSQQSLEPPRESALDVLKKRYARGEIDKQEFDEKKRDLDA